MSEYNLKKISVKAFIFRHFQRSDTAAPATKYYKEMQCELDVPSECGKGGTYLTDQYSLVSYLVSKATPL